MPGLDTPLLSECQRYATTPEPESDRASGHATPSPPTSAHIVAERRHSAVTQYAERSVPGLDTPLLSECRRYATTPEAEYDRASGLVTTSSPHTSAPIVAERRHSAITQYAERSATCRDSTRPCCRSAGGTPLLQSRNPTARAVTLSVNPRQRRGTSADADAPQTRQGQPSVQKNPPAEAGGFKSISVVWII